MTRGRVRALFAWGLVAGLASLAWIYVVPFPAVLLSEHNITSTRILDRHGRGLREVFGAAGGRARWTKLEGVSPWLPLALIHAEDRRFYSHTGVDPIAMVRSMVYNARLGRVVTGASTITQQTVKVVMHRGERRGVALKIEEMAWALRLERAADKDMILEQYVNRLPFGNLLFGVGAASRMYLGKAPDRLTLAEAVLLAQIPSSPSRNTPYADMERARQRARALLGVMLERGAISSSQYERALDEALTIKPRRGRVIAAHFTEHVHGTLEESSAPREVHTTLELELQRAVHGIVRQHVTMLQDQHVEQAAALVVHNPTGEVLAWVGSREYWDEERAGANDGVVALRQPGSVLKPFVYAMYFDEGGAPFHQVEDREVQFPTEDGAYIPKNYDRRTHGWVSLRQALGSSLNIPAVVLTERLGADHVLAKLREAGLTSLDESPEHYGLGVALGNGEVRMLEVAEAYATLASGGVRRPVSVRKDLSMGPGHRVFSEQAAYMALDVLRDDFAREIGFGRRSVLDLPFDVAMKTGTSTGYRDNWAVGVTPEYTVAAWAGNFDGSPMHHTSGIVGAAPIVRQVMQALHPGAANRGSVAWFERPPG
ncbi:MAG: penicillin-binding protein 1C, partial [Myxococcota bacterium]